LRRTQSPLFVRATTGDPGHETRHHAMKTFGCFIIVAFCGRQPVRRRRPLMQGVFTITISHAHTHTHTHNSGVGCKRITSVAVAIVIRVAVAIVIRVAVGPQLGVPLVEHRLPHAGCSMHECKQSRPRCRFHNRPVGLQCFRRKLQRLSILPHRCKDEVSVGPQCFRRKLQSISVMLHGCENNFAVCSVTMTRDCDRGLE